jgi:hypothetical protein
MLIGAPPDLKTPIVPILALLITFHDHGADLGERVLSGNLEIGVGLPFRIFDEATRGPDVEAIQSRLGARCDSWKGCLERGAPPSSSHRLRSSRWLGRFGALLMLVSNDDGQAF